MKQCELCENPAKMYCDSDRANLCWDCDKKVHGANFLVARHSRTLLCSTCQNPTPWRGSGLKLVPAVSICGDCVIGCDRAESRNEVGEDCGGGDGHDSSEDDDGEDEDDDSEHGKEEDEDEENQVVPWNSSPPPNPSSRSSSSDEVSTKGRSSCRETIPVISRKRQRPQ